MTAQKLLVANRLRVETLKGTPIVEDVSLELGEGEIIGVVGESGSGKTTLSLALLGYARPGVRIAAGFGSLHRSVRWRRRAPPHAKAPTP